MLDVKVFVRLARPTATPCPDLDTEVKGIDGDELDIGASRGVVGLVLPERFPQGYIHVCEGFVQFGCGPFFSHLRQPIHPEPFLEASGIAGHQQIPDDTIIIAQNFRHGMLRCMIGTYKHIPQQVRIKTSRTRHHQPTRFADKYHREFQGLLLVLAGSLAWKGLGTHDPDQG